MSDWIEQLKQEKKRKEDEEKYQLLEKQQKDEKYKKSPEWSAILAHDKSFDDFYISFRDYSSEVGKLTGKYISIKTYEDKSGLLLTGPKELISSKTHEGIFRRKELDYADRRRSEIYRENSIRISKNDHESVKTLFGNYRQVGKGRLLTELKFTFRSYQGSPSWGGSESHVGGGSWSVDFYNKTFESTQFINLSQLNQILFEKISKWLIYGGAI